MLSKYSFTHIIDYMYLSRLFFSGFFTTNENIHNHYRRQTNQLITQLAKSSQRSRTLRYSGVVKINNYFINRLNYNCYDGKYKKKLKEYILAMILHLYGKQKETMYDK